MALPDVDAADSIIHSCSLVVTAHISCDGCPYSTTLPCVAYVFSISRALVEMKPPDDQIIIQAFLPSDQLFVGEPTGIRAVAFERLARDLDRLFENRREEIVRTLMDTYKLSRIEAYPRMLYYFQKMRAVYGDESERLSKPLRETMYQAVEEEKAGNINKAIQLFEELSDNAFTPSMPYERLRIIYIKQGFYNEAIRVCERYIEVLNMIKAFWVEYPNIKSIPKYQEHIKKLSAKLQK
jgi:tetratricopeptide (TPR) repeat protein